MIKEVSKIKLNLKKDSKKIILDIISLYFLKFLSLILALFLTPIYIVYFYSSNILGFWFTAISFFNWLMFFDIGISGGLRNKLVTSIQKNDFVETKSLISNSFFTILLIMFILIISSLFLIPVIDWRLFFGLAYDEISKRTIDLIVTILVVGVSIRFFTVLISQIFYSLQKPLFPSIMIILSNFIILIYMIYSKNANNETDLIYLSFATLIANNLPSLLFSPIIFLKYLPNSFPQLRYVSFNKIKSLFNIGTKIFLIQVLMALLFNFREIIISSLTNPQQVVEYQVFLKSVGFISSIIVLGFAPLWSSINKLYINSNLLLIKKIFKNGLLLIFLSSLLYLPLLYFLPILLNFWIPNFHVMDLTFKSIIYSISSVLFLLSNFYYSFYLGTNKEKLLLQLLVISNLLNLLLLFIGSFFYDSWILVIITSSVSSLFLLKRIKIGDINLDIFSK
jgi:O-antigen/teichoic acid export membrane protein